MNRKDQDDLRRLRREERDRNRLKKQQQNQQPPDNLIPAQDGAAAAGTKESKAGQGNPIDKVKFFEKVGTPVFGAIAVWAGTQGFVMLSAMSAYVAFVAALLVVFHILNPNPSRRAVKQWAALALLGLILAAGLTMHQLQLKWDKDPAVALKPGNEPSPPTPQLKRFFEERKNDKFTIFFAAGGAVALKSTNLITLVRFKDERNGPSEFRNLLTMEQSRAGPLISGEFWGPKGEVIALLDRGRLESSNDVLRIKKDRSSMSIFDKQNNEVLLLRYLNSTSIVFRGSMWLPTKERAFFTESNLVFGITVLRGNTGGDVDHVIDLVIP